MEEKENIRWDFSENSISIYAIVMGIIKCEKVFAGFLFFLVCLRSKTN